MGLFGGIALSISEELCEEIKKINKRLDKLERQMQNIRESKAIKPKEVLDFPDKNGKREKLLICGACHKRNVEGHKFCPECGTPVLWD